MGRAAKSCRLDSHQRAKKLKKGVAWKDSSNFKTKKLLKKAGKKKKKLKGELITSTPKYTEDVGYKGTFKGSLVKQQEDGRWQVKWEDGSVQDAVREEWFTRDAPNSGGASKGSEKTAFLDMLVKKKGIDQGEDAMAQ
jgi:hypothetical protein